VSTDDEIQDALLSIYSRLGGIEGKVNLVARAERARILEDTESSVRKQPLIGQIYLLLDGKRTQKEIQDILAKFGITPSQPTVSRRMSEMETEHGMADLVRRGVYRKDPQMEKVLNLSKNIRKWLDDEKQTVPEP
jgi:hypothetical protein